MYNDTDVAFTCDYWTSCASDRYITMTMHWIREDWTMATGILGTSKFSDGHTAENIAAKLKDIRLTYGELPRVPGKEEYYATRLEYLSTENFLDRPTMTTDLGSDISKGAELNEAWDWNRCICHCLHIAVATALDEPSLKHLLEIVLQLTTTLKYGKQ